MVVCEGLIEFHISLTLKMSLKPNQPKEPTAVGAGRSAVVVHGTRKAWFRFYLIGLLTSVLFFSTAFAAEHGEKLSLKEKVRLANLIVVGKLNGITCTSWGNCYPKVKEVIFGSFDTNKVLLVGFMDSGFLKENDSKKTYILFLEKWPTQSSDSKTVLRQFVGESHWDYDGLEPETDETIQKVKKLVKNRTGEPK